MGSDRTCGWAFRTACPAQTLPSSRCNRDRALPTGQARREGRQPSLPANPTWPVVAGRVQRHPRCTLSSRRDQHPPPEGSKTDPLGKPPSVTDALTGFRFSVLLDARTRRESNRRPSVSTALLTGRTWSLKSLRRRIQSNPIGAARSRVALDTHKRGAWAGIPAGSTPAAGAPGWAPTWRRLPRGARSSSHAR